MITASRFAWECVGSPAWPPPEPKRGAERYGPDAVCWLCGGPTDGVGWPLKAAISPTFTNQTLAAVPSSTSVCQPCAYMGSGDAWRAYCASRPEKGWKSVSPLSWRSYSHVFRPGFHDCPRRNEWRGLLLDPPEPPFMYVIAESGQKHIVYRGTVAHSRDYYPVQYEEDRILVERGTLGAVMTAFEGLLAMGFTRDEVLAGRYSQGRLGKANIAAWRAREAEMRGYRGRQPGLVRLAHMAAHGPEREVKA